MTSIEITFLGTTAGVPTPKRNHASLYLRYQSENEFIYLFDCGEGTQRQIFSSGLNFMRINDIFISHWHADHFAGLMGLMQTMNLERRAAPIRVFGPEAATFVPKIMDIGYFVRSFPIEGVDVNFERHELAVLLDNPEFYIASVPVKHAIPAVAYAFVEKDRIKIDKEKAKKLGLPEKGPIFKQLKEKGKAAFKGKQVSLDDIALVEKGKKIVYSGDTVACKSLEDLAQNADLLIHDSTFFEEDYEKSYRHATVEDVIKIAKRANVKQLVLTHISRRYQDTDELKDKIKGFDNVSIAKDFMKIIVK
ncbi:MAG TPA: ribonuclease Z [archaeon]|nr:ribonuclease Z [archaeon]